MKKTAFAILLAAAGLLSVLPAAAQEMNHGMHAMQTGSATAPQVHGEIRKVDTDTGKITIRHADIPNLGMPPMTMVFRAAAPDLLAKAKVGDQILFTAEKTNGVLTVTSIEAEPVK
ncbi:MULTISPECIES: copper-binding protein [unclassified Herbaspirillum]|uniref:copper-binding protein n=1 Tax=unclassified Herbaspirillum TaxID=2624150 RepID=UPI000E2FB6DE|nr:MULTISPECIES: copper-binding protein [unclassified Herbaspirillum]RFB73657.1 RND transporter [Herbaspirillum sp. 3R-3a1]TFI10540.1 copper-binding protein [Herbaspirillum sp. 3R11]TFI16445.1 copper-binding protein [Herbaspirillum sp. 3R-11]TFI21392.1 copper-binding protein [Herbaspirillum sp. 3C11]